MSKLKRNNTKGKFLIAMLIMAIVMWGAPALYADTGHIGSKPPNADGDGVPNQSDPDFAYGSRNGEQIVNGDGNQGDNPASDGGDGIPNGGPIEGNDPASDGGDGIPNGGPIEGDGHSGKGWFDVTMMYGIYGILYIF